MEAKLEGKIKALEEDKRALLEVKTLRDKIPKTYLRT